MIGRKQEIKKIQSLLASKRSEFLAITGRRRVGKTFLIDTLLRDAYCFSMTGIQNGDLNTQLVNFSLKLAEYQDTDEPIFVRNWQIAFLHLKRYLKTLDKNKKQVIFLDELPWIYTARSGFVQLLAHFWNDYLSKESHFILVICGSATSWITQKIINDTGGLHNRVTEIIHLRAFSLSETRDFLNQKRLRLSNQEIAKIYMTLGGIPFYLESLQRGESFAAAIERICFSPQGLLYNEYNNLYQSLFKNPEIHEAIVKALATHQYGLSHQAILQKIGLQSPTGSYHRAIEELQVSDFIEETIPFGKKKRGATFRLVDEYSIFYHRFVKPNQKYVSGIWLQLSASQSFKIWAGYAFEALCHKHIEAIKKALGIGAVFTKISSLSVKGTDDEAGFQIDLLIDRKDDTINLCEIKFYSGPFTITKAYARQLLVKRQRFLEYTKTKKQVFLTFISNYGLVENGHSRDVVDVELVLEDLMDG